VSRHKKLAIEKIIASLSEVKLDVNAYYDDTSFCSSIDSILHGNLSALLQHCDDLGWVQLSKFIKELLPIEGTAIEIIESIENYILPETFRMLEVVDVENAPEKGSFWDLVHPRIKTISKPRFDAGFYGDSVESAFKEVNNVVKKLVFGIDGREIDRARLMTSAFSLNNPIIRLSDLSNESERNIQQGYMQIFAGAMTGIRNPKAHANLNPDRPRTIHLLMLASLLMTKVDERI
jgi:uncharacterized protein (TIGR02391 family)